MEQAKLPSGWINHFSTWISKLPGPAGYYYLALGVLLLLLQSLTAWAEGALPWGTLLAAQVFLAAAAAFILGVIPYFDRLARQAFQRFLPISTVSDELGSSLQFKLSNLPPLQSGLASLILVGVVLLLEWLGSGPYLVPALEGFLTATAVTRGVYFLCWACYAVFIYHSLHQLALINRIFIGYTRVDLFRMKPLSGFSNLAALTAVSLVLLPYGFLVANPGVSLADPIVLGMYGALTAIALITFLLPQLGIHRLQQEERDRLLDEVYQRYDGLWAELHASLDKKKVQDLSRLTAASALLEKELALIKGISTWPWQPETVRWLLTALVLPFLMWLAQYFLGKTLP